MGVRPLVFGHTFRLGLASSSLENASRRLCTTYNIEADVGGGGGTHAPCDGHGTLRTLHFLFGHMLCVFLYEVVSAAWVESDPRVSHGCS